MPQWKRDGKAIQARCETIDTSEKPCDINSIMHDT